MKKDQERNYQPINAMTAGDKCNGKGRPLLCRLVPGGNLDTCTVNSNERLPIAIGTDRSGMETHIHALRNLGTEARHWFASEINENAVRTIKANPPRKSHMVF